MGTSTAGLATPTDLSNLTGIPVATLAQWLWRGLRAGVWGASAPSPLAPSILPWGQPLTDETRYSGGLVRDRQGRWQLLTFRNRRGLAFDIGGSEHYDLASI
jgi:hypothetical protein